MNGLVGHTGLVGTTLLAQTGFDALYNSRNVEDLAGRHFRLLVCAGAPAQKWLANRHPATDAAAVARLTRALARTTADHFVLISTVDVLPEPNGADEDTPIDVARQQPYGRHRHELERFAHAHFPNALTVRLPGLFGPGLKKNALYDLLHGNETHKIHSGGVFQFYPLVRLWADLNRAAALGVPLVHFATAPLSVREIAAEAFGLDFVNELPTPPARYDFRSRHAAALGGADGYLYGRDAVLDELRRFVAAERSRLRATGILEPGLAA